MTLETLNFYLAVGTLAMQIATVVLLLAFFFRRSMAVVEPLARWLALKGLWLGLIFSFFGSVTTLYYSEVLGIEPCPLCWWQRIFLYPQIILFSIALYRRDLGIATYSIVMSAIGAGFALYHHALQVLPSGVLPCPAQGVSCAQRFVFEFGYITFPLMGFSLFVFLIALMLFLRRGHA